MLLAHQFAIESSMVQAEAISVQEFPELSELYGVSGLPHIAIVRNEGEVFEPIIGAISEPKLVTDLQHILH